MKNKLLLFLLFFLFLGNKLSAKNFEKNLGNSGINLEFSTVNYIFDTIKKSNIALKTSKTLAIIPPPLTTAGSSCKEAAVPAVTVFVTASGGSGDVIEWFESQTSTMKLHTGSIYAPSISKTTTFYVQSHSGSDLSIRVPVVASVYNAPPTVTLTASPSSFPVCLGTPIKFTASDGAPGQLLFEFSIDGIVKQQMSSDNTFTTSDLLNDQTVSVRTRFAVNFDGSITEAAWGIGTMEDNVLSSSLSSNALGGYINSLQISPTEDKLIFGIAGKLIDNRSMLLFLDTKPGGFNVADYGDETFSIPSVKGFNFFNNNPSKFDSYFQADYCIAIATDDGGTNYFADVIELKSGISTKVKIGNASTGFPSAVMGVNNGNTGVNDYKLGFEVEVLKSLLGYTSGDIKFFALTMQDNDINDVNNYSVTNSFLSPELNSNLDYGSAAIDYNFKDPNPVVVSADALIPCYKEASFKVSITEQPTTAVVGSDQITCTLTSASLEGNSPSVGTGNWSVKSGPGTAVFSDIASGSSTATVSVEGLYTFTWTITNGNCTPSTAEINVNFKKPIEIPTLSSVVQPTCILATGSFTITNYDSSYTYIVSPSAGVSLSGDTVTAPEGIYTLTASLGICTSAPSASNTVNAQPVTPVPPTLSSVTQPTCSSATGSFMITNYDPSFNYSANPSAGVSISGNTVTAPEGIYTLTATLGLCTSGPSTSNTVNAQPVTPVPPILSVVMQPTCGNAAGSFTIMNYDSSYTYIVSPSAGVSLSGDSVTAPEGMYTLTATLGACTSTPSSSSVVNAQPVTPAPPTLSSVTQPTCSSETGSFTITNYDTSFAYMVSPSAGVTISGNTITAPEGIYTLTATLGACTSVSSTSNTVNAQPVIPTQPALSSVTQPTCNVATGSFTISNYDGTYTYTVSPSAGVTFSGSNVTAPAGTYTITATLGVCQSSANTIINAQPITPAQPTLSSVTQPNCSDAKGSFMITNYNASYNYVSSPSLGVTISGNTVTAPEGMYTLTATLGSCTSNPSASNTVNAQPSVPIQPALSSVTQPTCNVATGSFTITNYNSSYTYTVSPSVGIIISGNTITGPSGSYTVTATLGLCSTNKSVIINPIPLQIQFESTEDCVNKDYILTATALNDSFNPNNVTYLWKDNLSNLVGTNSNVLNVTDVVNSMSGQITYPLTFTLTINNASTQCSTTENIIIESIYCNIQKGISPDGNGLNDFFDLKNMDVKNLEIFDRYGIKVYDQSKYIDQWKGQSNKGNELPSATYYYVIEFNNGKSKTGWIYLIREK